MTQFRLYETSPLSFSETCIYRVKNSTFELDFAIELDSPAFKELNFLLRPIFKKQIDEIVCWGQGEDGFCAIIIIDFHSNKLYCYQNASYGIKKNGSWYTGPSSGWKTPTSRKQSLVDGEGPNAGLNSKPSSGRVIRIINNLDHTIQVRRRESSNVPTEFESVWELFICLNRDSGCASRDVHAIVITAFVC